MYGSSRKSDFLRAAYRGDIGNVRRLLATGIPIDAAGPLPTDALTADAAIAGRPGHAHECSALGAAAAGGHAAVARLLLDHGAAADACTPHGGLTPLHLLAASTASIGEGPSLLPPPSHAGHRDRTPSWCL